MSVSDDEVRAIESLDNEADPVADVSAPMAEDPAVVRNNIMDSSDEELSELDEEEFQQLEKEVPLDEQVYQMGRYKKSGADTAGKKKAEKVRQKNVPPKAAASKSTKSKRSRSGSPTGSIASESEPEPEENLTEEQLARREFEAKMDAALKGKSFGKRRKLAGDDLEAMQDEKVAEVRELMIKAAREDAEAIRNSEPATRKLAMLPQVKNILQKHYLADSILDNNLLEAMRMWLEPLPDASLPAFEIQKVLFQCLDELPIKTIHLRESGLAKVVLFYQRSKRPQVSIKRIADRLVGEWTRPIMGRSDSYRDKVVAQRGYDPIRAAMNYKKVQGNPLESSQDPAVLSALRRNRAFIPSATSTTFQVAPQSHIADAYDRQGNSKDGDNYKKIRMKMQLAKQTKGRKSGVSIEGRGLPQ